MPSLGSQMVERAISYREMISRFYPLVRLRTEHLLDAIDTQVARGPGPGPVGAGTALDFALLVDQLAECYVSAASIFDRRRRLMKSQIILTALLEGDGEFHSGVKDRLRLAFASVEGGPTLVEQFNKTVDAARPGIRLRYLEAYRAVFAYEQATVASIQQIAARQLSHVAGEARARVKLLQDDIDRIDQETARLGGAVPQRRSLIDRLDTGSEEF